jgi:hypothetical protein
MLIMHTTTIVCWTRGIQEARHRDYQSNMGWDQTWLARNSLSILLTGEPSAALLADRDSRLSNVDLDLNGIVRYFESTPHQSPIRSSGEPKFPP